ncbi:hypothetical protein ANN_18514 [Periplaneta americana]|uniref:Uncharacterized protein n=1 Tax=Periplaneta americana TaxID=6978 RepID=A0ABQ8SNZ1_PERAM|nr:hypothetical protein ANN_18514 [Periplaneta americana]
MILNGPTSRNREGQIRAKTTTVWKLYVCLVNGSKTGWNFISGANKAPLMSQLSQEIME